jgi:glycosyltransferase involved in cell wall biosynthesis
LLLTRPRQDRAIYRLSNSTKPNLLILTSSFPRNSQDETCGYVRDFARNMSTEFNVRVLTLDDHQASEWPEDVFTLIRSKSFIPSALNRAQASGDLNELVSESLLVKLASALALLSYFLRAFRLALRADVICSHWMIPCGLIGAIIARLQGKPHVVIEHSGALHLLARMRGGQFLARFVTTQSRRVITVSQELKSKLLALCPTAGDKVDVIPMGVKLNPAMSEFRPVACKKTVLFVGRLTPIKGVDLLLDALRSLDNVRLIVAGDGEQRRELESLAEEYSIDAQFLGRVTAQKRDSLLSMSDVVVIPSLALEDGRTEGMPVVCLEAMAAGRPVVASRAGGLSEIIDDGKTGLLFEPGDSQMLSNKLQMLFDDAALGESIARKSRETASAFGWDTIGQKFARIIKDSLRSNEPVINDQRYKTENANG